MSIGNARNPLFFLFLSFVRVPAFPNISFTVLSRAPQNAHCCSAKDFGKGTPVNVTTVFQVYVTWYLFSLLLWHKRLL